MCPGANMVNYLHGVVGKGQFAFLGRPRPGRLPAYGRIETDPFELHRNSPGYRLILNNVLFPAARKEREEDLMKGSWRAIIAWSMYDWANSVFATTVMVAFFPVFFKSFWSHGVDSTLSTARLGIGNTVAGIAIAVLSLFLGAFADTGRDKKKLLGIFMLIGVVSTGLLVLSSPGASGCPRWRIRHCQYRVLVLLPILRLPARRCRRKEGTWTSSRRSGSLWDISAAGCSCIA